MKKEEYRDILSICENVDYMERVNQYLRKRVDSGLTHKLTKRHIENKQREQEINYVTHEIHSDKYPMLIWDFSYTQLKEYKQKVLNEEDRLFVENSRLMYKLDQICNT